MDYITLNNGLKMPLLGFGTMNIFDEGVYKNIKRSL